MKKYVLMAMVTIMVASSTGCSHKPDFAKDVFLKYTSTPAGEGAIYEFYDTNVEVYSDGTVEIYCDDFEKAYSDDYPTKEIQLSEDEIRELKDAILENDILSLPKNISSDSCDGSYQYITVYLEDDKHKTGGLNVAKRRFKEVEDLLFEMVGEDVAELLEDVQTIQEEGSMD